jgi:hypothetical protein
MTNIELLKEELVKVFNHLTFNEDKHIYTYFNIRLKPVSDVIKNFYKPFDTNKMAFLSGRKMGIPAHELIKQWEDKKIASCTLGTETHFFAENWTPDSVPTNGMEESVCNYFKALTEAKNGIFTAFKEFRMFSKNLLIAGTADRIDFNPETDSFRIIDYKTNEDLYKNYKGQRMLKPFEDLLDNPFNKYQIQLSLYQLLFELTGYKVEKREIVWFKPDGTFQILEATDLTPKLKEYYFNEYLCQ